MDSSILAMTAGHWFAIIQAGRQLSEPGVGGMRRLRTAIRNRHGNGERRASLAEYALTIALVAVLVSASVLWLVAQFGG